MLNCLLVQLVLLTTSSLANGEMGKLLPNMNCEDGWQPFTNKTCIHVTGKASDFFTAYKECKAMNATIVSIEDVHENSHLQGIVRQSGRPHWIGLYCYRNKATFINELYWLSTMKPPMWYNWASHYHHKPCSQSTFYTMATDGKWRICFSSAINICQEKAICRYGYYGPDCRDSCNCRGRKCEVGFTECPNGCESGWVGPKCDQRRQKPKVTYYCFDTPSEGQYMLLHIDGKGTKYRAIYGETQTDTEEKCRLDDQISHNNIARVNVTRTNETNLAADCGGRLNEESGRVEWKFHLEEIDGVQSSFDQIIEVACQFRRNDSLRVESTLLIEGVTKIEQRSFKPSKDKVILSVIDSTEEEAWSAVMSSSRIRLKMTLHKAKGSPVVGFFPHSCIAESENRNHSKTLTDIDGCPTEGSPVKFKVVNNTVVISEEFTTFGFENSALVTFKCDVHFCFSEDKCTHEKFCDYKTRRRSALGLTHLYRSFGHLGHFF